MIRIGAVALLITLMFFVSGCSRSQVADDLGQRDANEIVAILRGHGIESSVEKQKGGKGRYSVQVREKDFGASVSILSALGLPEEKKPGFAELVGSGGLLPSSREVEALRLDRAAAAELEELLKGLPSVVSASVVVRAHGLASGVLPSVSAVVQTKTGMSVAGEEVRALLARTVPGLKRDEIVLSVAEQMLVASNRGIPVASGAERQEMVPFLIFWKVPQSQYLGLASLVVGLILLVGCGAGLVGYVLGQYFLSRSTEFSGNSEGVSSLGGESYTRLAAPEEQGEGGDEGESREVDK